MPSAVHVHLQLRIVGDDGTVFTDSEILHLEKSDHRPEQGNRIWSLRLLKAGSTSWGSGAINSDRGCRNAEEPASVRSFARRKGSSAVNHLPDFSYAIALSARSRWLVDRR